MSDYVHFHEYMNMCREMAGVSLEELGKGLYTKSMMARVERGECLPNYMIRNRIMERLGISSEGYEDFLQPNEYDRFMRRVDLMEAIESNNIELASALTEALINESEADDNKVELQFLYDMRARCCKYNSESLANIRNIYRIACECTMIVPEYNEYKPCIFSSEEYFLLFCLIESECELEGYSLICCTQFYKYISDVLKSLEASVLDKLSKTKVYPLGATLLGKIARAMEYNCNAFELEQFFNKAIEYLRAKGRSYHFFELTQEMISYYRFIFEKGDESAAQKLSEIIKWRELFSDIYTNHSIDIRMEYNCYIYRNSDVYCIGDVIKSRRKMLGLSREELSMRAGCSCKTLMRIENRKISAQKAVVKSIFRELNLLEDFRRADIVTKDRNVIECYFEFAHATNHRSIDESEEIFRKLEDLMSEDTSNLQIMNLLRCHIALLKGSITPDEFADGMRRALKLTIPMEIMNIKQGYLAHNEQSLLKAIMKNTSNIAEKEYLSEYLYEYIESRKYGSYPADFGNYESIMIWLGDECSDKDYLEKVKEVSGKILLLELKSHRLFELHTAIYLLMRNSAKTENVHSSAYFIEENEKICSICDFIHNTKHKEYYKKIEELIRNGNDWKYY